MVSFFESHDFHPRLRCECCGYRTRPIYEDEEGVRQPSQSPAACILCEWENVPVDDNGEPVGTAPTDEERNDGHTLAEAKANFARFLSMYDPQHPPAWMLGPPPEDELKIRGALREAYEAVDRDPASLDKWDHVLSLEGALEELVRRRIQAAHDQITYE